MTHPDTHKAVAVSLVPRPGGAQPVVVPVSALLLVAGMIVWENVVELGRPLIGLLVLLISLLIVG
jgi:hypothetical protein